MATASAFQYNYAIVCRIPNSFADRSIKKTNEPINLDLARQEYQQLKETLKNCSINIIELQEDENYPDCCFVEDCAVTIGGTALITRPGHETRQGEVAEIRRVLRDDLKMWIVEIKDAQATLDGGDVLFTGKEIFVGTGNRTNLHGVRAVAEAFSDYTVSPIDITGLKILHLKDAVNMAGRDVLAVSKTPPSQKILKLMKQNAQFSYKVMELDGEGSTDMLYINGRLIHKTREQMGEANYSVLDEKILYPRQCVSMRELSKAYGTLSAMVLLISKQKNKNLVSTLTPDDIMPFPNLKE